MTGVFQAPDKPKTYRREPEEKEGQVRREPEEKEAQVKGMVQYCFVQKDLFGAPLIIHLSHPWVIQGFRNLGTFAC